MNRLHFLFFLILVSVTEVSALDPTATDYTFFECQGSAIPYPARNVKDLAYPDSLTPVALNHVGRHGARFLSSSKYTTSLLRVLNRADSLRTITPMGREIVKICQEVIGVTAGRWGALDSLGMAEQRAIASRAFMSYPSLFDNTKIKAISSYVPRCIMSMYEFTHQLSRLNNKVEIMTSSGRQNSELLRPWLEDVAYKDYIASEGWHKVYEDFLGTQVPVSVAERALGKNFPFVGDEAQDVSMSIYKVLSGCAAMSIEIDLQKYFTRAEINALWSVENLHHYLTYSASTLSDTAPGLASSLVAELIKSIDESFSGTNPYSVTLRFGHAETMMPLLALLHIPGCYYMTNYFDTVGLHWRDFYVVPMASNLQMILFRSNSGRYYLRTDLNEIPVTLIPGRDTVYVPWETAREYLNRCLPLHKQL